MTIQKENIQSLLDSIRAIAQEGLSYAQNEYDRARYKKLLNFVSKKYSTISGISNEDVRDILLREMGSITPKLGIDVAIMNEADKLLVLKRSDDNAWSLPCGFADVEETPFQTAQRETMEETGLKIQPIGYIAISQKGPHNYPGFVHQINICVATKKTSSKSNIRLSHEHTEFKWIGKNEKIDWHRGHERLPGKIFEAYKNESFISNIP